MIGKWLCKKFDMHSYKYLTEPVYDRVRLGDGANVIFAPRMRKTLRYCKRCRTLEYHEQIRAIKLDAIEKVDYSNLVGNLVQDPYNLEVEDLTMIGMIHPELYDYCKLWLKKS